MTTYKAFLKELRALRGKFEVLTPNVNSACYGEIRTVKCLGWGKRRLCPIEGVAFFVQGDAVPHYATALNLDVGVRDRIVIGSDYATWHVRNSAPSRRRTRRDLLRALGLKEVKPLPGQ